MSLLSLLLHVLVLARSAQSISSKVDFSEEQEIPSNSSNLNKDDEDVEVKHTIVVSTKLRNNNRRGLIDDKGALTYAIGSLNQRKDDSGEVPVVKAYKSVETTFIRSPDTRQKAIPMYIDHTINRNSRDDLDFYPNLATNPMQWKPSTLYSNINWYNQDNNNYRRSRPDYQKFHRGITDDGVREFYCKKCRELSGPGAKGCIQQRSSPWIHENATPKIKLDGKMVKLN